METITPTRVLEYNRAWYARHAEEQRARASKYYTEHTEARLEYARAHYEQLREQVFDLLGHACSQCGSTEDLAVDHIYNNGATERAQGILGVRLCNRVLATNGEGYQILCRTCNRRKAVATAKEGVK